MLRLGPRSRGALAAAGLTAFALAYATTPLVASEDAAPLAAESSAPLANTPAPAPLIAVAPRRDPFAGIPEAHDTSTVPSLAPNAAEPATSPTLPPLPTLPALPALPGALGVLPPNAGAELGLPPSDGVRVTAVITGIRPSAIVEDRRGARIVTVGDSVGDDRVVAIDANGVRTASGTTYAVTPAGPAPLVWPHSPTAPRPSSPQPLPSGGLP